MRVLGIDAGMGKAAGFVLVDVTDTQSNILGKHLETYHYTDKTGKSRLIPLENFRKRCRRFQYVVREILLQWKPELIVSELDIVSFETHAHGAVSTMARLNGVLFATITEDIPVILIQVSSWQSYVLHYSRGDDMKALSIAHVFKQYGQTLSHHVTDAVCMCEAVPHFLTLVEQDANAVKGKVRLYT